jgi:hypothetical protein
MGTFSSSFIASVLNFSIKN